MGSTTPKELVDLILKELQTSKKKVKYAIPWLLSSVIAESNLKERARLGLDAGPNSNFGWSELRA